MKLTTERYKLVRLLVLFILAVLLVLPSFPLLRGQQKKLRELEEARAAETGQDKEEGGVEIKKKMRWERELLTGIGPNVEIYPIRLENNIYYIPGDDFLSTYEAASIAGSERERLMYSLSIPISAGMVISVFDILPDAEKHVLTDLVLHGELTNGCILVLQWRDQ